MQASRIVFVGGPDSGKSNYIFRLWIEIERQRGTIRKDGLPTDLAYLQDGAAALLSGKFAPRTARDTSQSCEIPVEVLSPAKTKTALVIPDVSGELWLDLYRRREWPAEWDAVVPEATGFVVMVRAGSPANERALDWLTCELLYDKRVPVQATGVPTQVVLVEWLQILRGVTDRVRGRAFVPRVSVIISAWDQVPAENREAGPLDYLETEYPLLSQFLRADAHRLSIKVFGLSILGGDPERDKAFADQFWKNPPGALGYSVSQNDGVVHTSKGSLFMPILWALGV